jgi:uncharacterized protein YecE (DUF72 family)
MPHPSCLRIGCAGWSLPRAEQERFPVAGSHLERYASRFGAVEINSSFHRPHRPATYARWSAAVPPPFRFAVKLPKAITHELRLQSTEGLLEAFLEEVSGLGEKLGCLLVQLPPSLDFEPAVAAAFFAGLRSRSALPAVCEPRHPSWFTPEADRLLRDLSLARVAADPACVPAAAEPGGMRSLAYYRLHGAPRTYYSAYDDAFLTALATRIRKDLAAARDVWCIFDNTALGAATRNALELQADLQDKPIG